MQKLNEVCVQMRASYEQAQENIKSLSEENHFLAKTFDDERLRLEKMHLQEVSRLHKAVKTMKKKATQFDIQRQESQSTIGQTKSNNFNLGYFETMGTDSDALTTIDNNNGGVTPASIALNNQQRTMSVVPSQDNFQDEKQLLILQNEQFRQTLDGQNVLISELQKALVYN